MRKQFIFSVLAIVIGLSQLQAQASCAAPFSITYPATSTATTGFSTAYEYWVKITVPTGNYQVNISKTSTSDYQYQTAELFEGTCASLDVHDVNGQVLRGINDLTLRFANGGTSPQSFYLKLTNTLQQNINATVTVSNFAPPRVFCLNCPNGVNMISIVQNTPYNPLSTSGAGKITANIIGSGNCVEFQNYAIATYTVTGNVTFKDFVSPGVRFIITKGSKLTLDHVRFTCCHAWSITLQGDAQLKVTGGSLLENAISGGYCIKSDVSTIVNTAGTTPRYAIEIDNGIINALEGGIYISNYNQTSTPYPYKFQNWINSNRRLVGYSLGYNFPTVSNLKALSATLNNGYNSPFVMNNETVYPSLLTAPNPVPAGFDFDYCFANNKIFIKNVGYKAPNGTIYGIDMGTASATNTSAQNKILQNIFDAGSNIYIENSNVNIINAAFTDRAFVQTNTSANAAGLVPESYLNISGVGTNKDIAPCEFYNATTAIKVNDYYSVNILNNKFTSKQVYANTYSAPPSGSFYSDGIFMNLLKNNVTNINNNTFTNLRTAINITYPINVIQLGTASIRNNLFRADIANTPATGNRFMADAIIINSLFTSLDNTGLTSLDIYKNNSNFPFRFILLSGIKNGTVNIDQNTAIIRSEPAITTGGFNNQFALQTDGLKNCNIRDNNWKSFGKIRPDQHFGTRSINSAYIAYTCNVHTLFGTAFLMEGASNYIQGQTNYDNSFYNSERGFSIKNNATTLSTNNNTSSYYDGLSYFSADLQWGGNTFDTYVDGALASLNNITLPNGQTGLPYVPINNSFGAGSPYLISTSCLPAFATGLCYFPKGTVRSCLTPAIPCYDPNPNNCPISVPGGGGGIGRVASMTAEVNNQTNYSSFIPQTRRLKKLAIFEMLMNDTTYLDSSLALKNWYHTQKNGMMGKLCKINCSLQANQLQAAQSTLLNFGSSTTFESYTKQYLNAYLYYQQKQSLLASQEAQLEVIAQSCPMIYGKLIHQSRGLLNLAHGYYVHYNDNCPNGSSTVMRTTSTSSSDESTSEISLSYSQKELSIRSELNGKQFIKIYDMQGKLLLNTEIEKIDNLYQLPITLNNGIYNCIISTDNGVINQKLIINE
jgi:hypothetical protein